MDTKRMSTVEVKSHLNRGWSFLLSPSRVWYCPQIRKCFIRLSSAWPPRRELSRLHCTGRIIPWEFSQIGAMINFKAWKYSGDALYFLVHHHRRFLVGPAFRPPRSPPPSPRSPHTDRRRGWSPLYPCIVHLTQKIVEKTFLSTLVLQSGENGKAFERSGRIHCYKYLSWHMSYSIAFFGGQKAQILKRASAWTKKHY